MLSTIDQSNLKKPLLAQSAPSHFLQVPHVQLRVRYEGVRMMIPGGPYLHGVIQDAIATVSDRSFEDHQARLMKDLRHPFTSKKINLNVSLVQVVQPGTKYMLGAYESKLSSRGRIKHHRYAQPIIERLDNLRSLGITATKPGTETRSMYVEVFTQWFAFFTEYLELDLYLGLFLEIFVKDLHLDSYL